MSGEGVSNGQTPIGHPSTDALRHRARRLVQDPELRGFLKGFSRRHGCGSHDAEIIACEALKDIMATTSWPDVNNPLLAYLEEYDIEPLPLSYFGIPERS